MHNFLTTPVITSIFFILISLGSAYTFFRLRIPAGIIIGPIFTFTALKFAGFYPTIPVITKSILYTIFGAFFATKISGVLNQRIKSIIFPVLITVLWYILITFLSRTVLQYLLAVNSTNAFLSVIPGGIAEMNIIALSYKADVSIINSFQLVRLFSIIIVMPALIKTLFKVKRTSNNQKRSKFFNNEESLMMYIHALPVLAIGGIGSIALTAVNFPAGGLMGSLLFVILYDLIFHRNEKLPPNLYTVTVSLLGGIIGTNVNIHTVNMLSQILVPVLVITSITLSSAFVLSFIIHLLLKKDYLPTLFGVMPGGLAIMLSLAESSTDDIFYVTSLQTVRLLTAVVIIPNLILFLGLL